MAELGKLYRTALSFLFIILLFHVNFHRFVAGQLSPEDLHISLSIGRRPTGV